MTVADFMTWPDTRFVVARRDTKEGTVPIHAADVIRGRSDLVKNNLITAQEWLTEAKAGRARMDAARAAARGTR